MEMHINMLFVKNITVSTIPSQYTHFYAYKP